MSTTAYPVGTIAKLFNLTERRVQQLAKDTIIPKPEKGKYDLVGCVRGYIKYLQERAVGKEVIPVDAHLERTRLLKAQADKAELEVKTLLGTLVAAEEVEIIWSGLIARFRSRMLAIPTRAAHALLSLKEFHDMEQHLKEMIHSALDELSRYDPNDILTVEEGSEAGSTAAEPEGKPVGG